MSDNRDNLVESVDEAVGSGGFGASEAAVVALARRYAMLLDAAVSVAAEFEGLEFDPPISASMYRRLERVEAAVNVATVAAELGPKLLAALESLGLSPAARARLGKAVPGGAQPVSPAKSALAGLRDEVAAKRNERGA